MSPYVLVHYSYTAISFPSSARSSIFEFHHSKEQRCSPRNSELTKVSGRSMDMGMGQPRCHQVSFSNESAEAAQDGQPISRPEHGSLVPANAGKIRMLGNRQRQPIDPCVDLITYPERRTFLETRDADPHSRPWFLRGLSSFDEPPLMNPVVCPPISRHRLITSKTSHNPSNDNRPCDSSLYAVLCTYIHSRTLEGDRRLAPLLSHATFSHRAETMRDRSTLQYP